MKKKKKETEREIELNLPFLQKDCEIKAFTFRKQKLTFDRPPVTNHMIPCHICTTKMIFDIPPFIQLWVPR